MMMMMMMMNDDVDSAYEDDANLLPAAPSRAYVRAADHALLGGSPDGRALEAERVAAHLEAALGLGDQRQLRLLCVGRCLADPVGFVPMIVIDARGLAAVVLVAPVAHVAHGAACANILVRTLTVGVPEGLGRDRALLWLSDRGVSAGAGVDAPQAHRVVHRGGGLDANLEALL